MRRPLRTVAIALSVVSAALLSACSLTPFSQHEPSELVLFATGTTRVLNNQFSDAARTMDHEATLTVHNGTSPMLVNELKGGAEADVLITGNKDYIGQAVSDGTVRSPVELVADPMVMIVSKGTSEEITAADKIPPGAPVSICDMTLPCGNSSQSIMKSNNLNISNINHRPSEQVIVDDVLSGRAVAGWVSTSEAKTVSTRVRVIQLPNADSLSNSLWAARTTKTKHRKEADDFIKTITSTSFNTNWELLGFYPVQDKK